MSKICHMTSVHPIFDIRIFYKECLTLAKASYEVVLVAPCNADQVVNNIQIRSVEVPRSRFQRSTKTVWEVFKKALAEKADVYHFHDFELMPAGIALKLYGKIVVYDAHEDLPNMIMDRAWIHKKFRYVLSKIANIYEKTAATFYDGIVAATEIIAARFSNHKTITIKNYPDINSDLHINENITQRNKIIYIGSFAIKRGLVEMVKAMSYIPDSYCVKLYLAGESSDQEILDAMKMQNGWDKVELMGWLQRDEISNLLSNAIIGLVVLHPTKAYIDSYPVKMFEYMFAGIPVISSDFPILREIITTADCGVLVDPLDPKKIADAIIMLLDNKELALAMGKRGQKAVKDKYNWEIEANRLLMFYDKLIALTFAKR